MPGNTCFGSAPPRGGELLWRGASGSAVHIRAHAANHSGYEAWCRSMDALTAEGMARPIGTTKNYWTSGVCYLGGNDDVGSNIFYSWNHSCGGTATLSIGVTHGNGCDHEDYALGDLWVFYR
jgi:hypothetical protein